MERYQEKAKTARQLPISIASVNLKFDENAAFLARAAACFGAKEYHIIGALPDHKIMHAKSGSMEGLTKIVQHKDPHSLLDYARSKDIYLVSVELDGRSVSIHDVQLPSDREIMLIVGAEETGVPEELLFHSDLIVHIPMPGQGWCLNTSQSANIILYEMSKRLVHG
jgi:tRNA G18 (ribose-2'-O)-methylase SpoU